jgi:drug/metabolite transporter (DMT)-like permease
VGIFMLNALIASLLPNLFFNYAFIYLESGVVSILASGAEPTAALVFGILIFSEIPTLPGFIGMVIVVGSIIILTNSKQEKQKITRGNNEQKDT